MVQPLTYLPETPSQTAGPYVHIGLIPRQAGFDVFEKSFGNTLASPGTEGEKISIEGRVFDGTGSLVRDALIEIWQADTNGLYDHPADHRRTGAAASFRGWGRAGTDFGTGLYRFETIKPGPVMGRHGRPMAPHITFWLVARGINIGLNTRLYFSDEAEANAADPVLNLIEQEARRQTLIAQRTQRGTETVYLFDIHLQGDRETVFFDL